MEFLEEGQVLKVKSVRLRDQGLYQCLASNNAGTQMRQFRLIVQGPCFIKDTYDTLTITLNPSSFIFFLHKINKGKKRNKEKKTCQS